MVVRTVIEKHKTSHHKTLFCADNPDMLASMALASRNTQPEPRATFSPPTHEGLAERRKHPQPQ